MSHFKDLGDLELKEHIRVTVVGGSACSAAGLENPELALPPENVIKQFLSEGLIDHKFGEKKKAKVEAAINSVGKFWLRDALYNKSSLESFFG